MKKKKKKSWGHTQEQYNRFIVVWNSSPYACDAVRRLKEEGVFPDWPELNNHSAQSLATALKRKGIRLKSLKWDPKNRTKKASSHAHLDFDAMAKLVE